MNEDLTAPIEADISWSEHTTPTSEDLRDDLSIIRQVHSPTAPETATATVPRVLRFAARRRRPMQQSRVGEPVRALAQNYSLHPIETHLAGGVGGGGGGIGEVHRHLSDASACSTLTFLTSSTSSMTDPWSQSGFVEDDEVLEMEVDMDTPSHGSGESPEVLLEPKIESPEDEVHMDDLQELAAKADTPTRGAGSSLLVKRPRGRPRKHPIPSLEDRAKIAKGRSKTGCITCRRRKKKCDEAKPICMNCEKNAVVCEGYPERTIWKSGRERGEEGTSIWSSQASPVQQLMESAARMRRISLPNIKLEAVIHGVETAGDRIFFEHYCYRLSAVLTVEGPTKNAFKDMLLPMATRHLGLMHSILALSSTNIDYQEPYGKELLAKHPDISVAMLQERSQFHQDEALKEFHLDIERQEQGIVQDKVLSVRYGQMLCLVVQSIAEGKATGEHRIHLQAYQRLMQDSQPDEGPFMEFIKEYFQFHIAADDIISLPQGRARLGGVTDDFELPKGVIRPEAVRLLGVQDGLFFYMSKITNIRNTIRANMALGREPVVDYTSLYRAAEIDAGIREWRPSWAPGDSRDLAGLLYKQMMWVYLWRTIYPPKSRSWAPDARIKAAVDDGIALLGAFSPSDQQQTLLLSPTFIIGCAAFEPAQRQPILAAVATIRAYTQLRNADRAVEVLKRVWKYMDERDERSWDWQSVAADMGLDFLAT